MSIQHKRQEMCRKARVPVRGPNWWASSYLFLAYPVLLPMRLIRVVRRISQAIGGTKSLLDSLDSPLFMYPVVTIFPVHSLYRATYTTLPVLITLRVTRI